MRDRKNVSFIGIPHFVMEVLSDSTEEYDRNEKMQIYYLRYTQLEYEYALIHKLPDFA